MSKATWPFAVAGTVAVAAALALPGGAAYATTTPPPAVNQGNTSVAPGNQALISLSAPVNICGVAAAILGSARAGCQGGATVGGKLPPPGSGPPSGPTLPGPTPKPKHHKPPKHHGHHHGHHGCTARHD